MKLIIKVGECLQTFSKIVLAFVVALRYSNSCTRAWRNWQTRTVQVRMGATP